MITRRTVFFRAFAWSLALSLAICNVQWWLRVAGLDLTAVAASAVFGLLASLFTSKYVFRP